MGLGTWDAETSNNVSKHPTVENFETIASRRTRSAGIAGNAN